MSKSKVAIMLRNGAARYLTTAALVAVLGVLLWQEDPLFVASATYSVIVVLPQTIQLAAAGVFLIMFFLTGGRLITNAIIMIAIVFFLPDIEFAWWRTALLDTADAIANGDRHRSAMIYAKMSHWASVAAYVLVLLVGLRIFVLVRRARQKRS